MAHSKRPANETRNQNPDTILAAYEKRPARRDGLDTMARFAELQNAYAIVELNGAPPMDDVTRRLLMLHASGRISAAKYRTIALKLALLPQDSD